jgi:eukaryotic-like serine/threonine-protein kinase
VASMQVELARAVLPRHRTAEARELATEALRGTRAQNDRFQQGRALEVLAVALAGEGSLDEAEERAREAVQLADAAPPFRRHTLAILAKVLFARGRLDAALEAAERAVAIEPMRGSPTGDDVAQLVLAEVLWATGRRSEAREAIARARDRVLALADAFSDQAWRDGYLTGVAHNARVLALSAEWTT